jgi:hypothetical protein
MVRTNGVKKLFNPRQLVFDFWLVIHDNHCSLVHEKPREAVSSNFAGARQLGRVGPNGVVAIPILSDPPHQGEGSIMSLAETLVSPVAASAPLDSSELRRQRGLAIAAVCVIRPDGKDNRYRVPSQTGNGHYLVSIDRNHGPDWPCDCKDFEKRGEACKHVYAVRAFSGKPSSPSRPPWPPAWPPGWRACPPAAPSSTCPSGRPR